MKKRTKTALEQDLLSPHENVQERVIDAHSDEGAKFFIEKGWELRKSKKEPSLQESFRESFENPTFILSSVVVAVCAFRFLFDGVTFALMGFSLTLDHTDPLAYGSILTPVLAGHAYIRAKAKNPKPKVDNPDA